MVFRAEFHQYASLEVLIIGPYRALHTNSNLDGHPLYLGGAHQDWVLINLTVRYLKADIYISVRKSLKKAPSYPTIYIKTVQGIYHEFV